MSFDRRGNFAGAVILPDAEISTSALVLSYIVRRMDFVFRRSFPQQFSAEVFRRSFPQKFSAKVFAEVFRSKFPSKFSAWILGIRHNFHETQ
jgi:hypothetical protein